jgi:RHS repeat-associated protein
VPTADPIGTEWYLLDSAAAVANSYTYDAFGVARSVSESVANRYRFGTKRLDVESSLCHFIAREYEPHFGRFYSRDPISLAGGYYYVQSGPTSWVDPHGQKKCAPVEGSLLALMIYAAQQNQYFTVSGKPDTKKRITWQLLSCLACEESSYDPCASGTRQDKGLMQLTPAAIKQCQGFKPPMLPPPGELTTDDVECCQWKNQPRFELTREKPTDPWSLKETPCPKKCRNSIWNIGNQVFCAARYLRYIRDAHSETVSIGMLICRYHFGLGSPNCKDDAKSDDQAYVKSVLECMEHLGDKYDPKDPNVVRPPKEAK